jgi:uncharacterized protein (UPF0332 family)
LRKVAKPVLLSKAHQNAVVAEMCLKNGQFDVACARYYYAVFQHLLFWLSKEEIGILKPENSSTGSHNRTIACFRKDMERRVKKNKRKLDSTITKLYVLSNHRQTADYSNSYKTENDAELCGRLMRDILDYMTTLYPIR